MDWLSTSMLRHPDQDPTRGDRFDRKDGRRYWKQAKREAHRDKGRCARPSRRSLVAMRACLLVFRGWW